MEFVNVRTQAELEKARKAGFTDRQAPFVAAAVLSNRSAPIGVIRRHLEATQPHLFEPGPVVAFQRAKETP